MLGPLSDDWAEWAVCRDLPDAERIFYPIGSDSNIYDEARAVCAGCPVESECLDYAMRTEGFLRYGVWGGKSPDQRERIAKAARRHLRVEPG